MSLKSLIHPIALFLALELTFIVCFFSGGLSNPPIRISLFDPIHRYYINRGYPKSWAGVSRADTTVSFPITKMPFTSSVLDGVTWVKIIDMRIFVVLWASVFIVAYFFAFSWVKLAEKRRWAKLGTFPLVVLLLVSCLLIYKVWFPRV